jgi:hypothetical protein
MSHNYYVEGAVKGRGVHNADYGATYDRTYKTYDFQSRENAERFLAACGYEAGEVREEVGTASGVGWQGTVAVYRRPGKGPAKLHDIVID